jgi:hypothetical protein
MDAQIPDTSSHWATKLFTASPNICGSSVWNVLHVALPEPGIFEVVTIFLENLHSPAL